MEVKRLPYRPKLIEKETWRDLKPTLDIATLLSTSGSALAAFLKVPGSEVAPILTGILGGLAYYARKAQPKELYPVEKDEPHVFLGKDEYEMPIRIGIKSLKRHLLVLGTTGSGKTVTLRGLSLLPVWLGAGLTFIDGKSDVTDTYEPFYSLVYEAGRIEDFLVLNFLDPVQSNTWNPLMEKNADVDYCMEVLAGLLPPATGDQNYWRGRGLSLMRSVMACLVYLRDHKNYQFDIWDVKSHLSFQKALELLDRVIQGEIPLKDKVTGRPIGELLLSYFNDLGPWHEALAEIRLLKQGKSVQKKAGGRGPREQLEVQHNYAVQQWTDVLSLLGGTFAPIFATKNSEISMSDIITNSRIFYVLLPSLGKARDTLQSMGRMVLTAIRMALFQLLGKQVVGEADEIKGEVRAFRPEFPHLGIFDEFGSYMVSGFSDVVAQARSLGYAAIFAGQEIGRFIKADEGEAKALMANTGIKIVMRTVDTDTNRFVVELAGESWYLVPSGIVEEVGIITREKVTQEKRLEKRPTIDSIDLTKFGPGDAYFFGEGEVRKGKIFYVKPEKTPKHFVILKPFPLKNLLGRKEKIKKKSGPSRYAVHLHSQLQKAKYKRFAMLTVEEIEEIVKVITPALEDFLMLPPHKAAKSSDVNTFINTVGKATQEIQEELDENAALEAKTFNRLLNNPPLELVKELEALAQKDSSEISRASQ